MAATIRNFPSPNLSRRERGGGMGGTHLGTSPLPNPLPGGRADCCIGNVAKTSILTLRF